MPGDGQLISVNDAINSWRSWQTRINEIARNGGGTFRPTQGTYRLEQEVLIPSGVRVEIPGDVVVVRAISDGNTCVFAMRGSKSGVSTALAVDAHEGDTSITVGNGALLTAGRLVLISDQTFKFGATGQNLEINQIDSIAGNVVSLKRPLRHNYATASAATCDDLNAVSNAQLRVDGQVINPVGTSGGLFFGFLCDYCTVTMQGQGPKELPGVCFKTSRGCGIDKGQIRDGQTPTVQGTSYGWCFDESSHECWVSHTETIGVRENPITNNSQDITAFRPLDRGAQDSSFNTHNSGCERIRFVAPVSIESKQYGIAVGFAGGGASDVDVVIDDAVISGAGSHGIQVAGDAGKESKAVHINNPKVVGYGIKNASSAGILIQNVIGGSLNGGDVDGKSGANVLQGVYVLGVNKFDVKGTRVRNAVWGFQQQSGTDVSFTDTWAENCSSLIYRSVIAGTRIKWNGPRGDNTNFSFLATDEVSLDVQRRISADRGDNSVTLTAWINEGTQQFLTALTANRTITLATPAFVGATFYIVRVGGGAFNLDVGGLKTLAAATWAIVRYDGAAWKLIADGTL